MTDLFNEKANNLDIFSHGTADSDIGGGNIFNSLTLGKGNVLNSTVTESFLFPFTKITGLTDIGGDEAFNQTVGSAVNANLGGKGLNSAEVGNSIVGGF